MVGLLFAAERGLDRLYRKWNFARTTVKASLVYHSNMLIREGRSNDAEKACRVLRSSIVELCQADHKGDAETLELWLANKTTENMRRWMTELSVGRDRKRSHCRCCSRPQIRRGHPELRIARRTLAWGQQSLDDAPGGMGRGARHRALHVAEHFDCAAVLPLSRLPRNWSSQSWRRPDGRASDGKGTRVDQVKVLASAMWR